MVRKEGSLVIGYWRAVLNANVYKVIPNSSIYLQDAVVQVMDKRRPKGKKITCAIHKVLLA